MKQQRWEESEKRKRRKIREEKGRRKKKKEDQSAREGRKVAKACVSPMFCGYGVRKVGLLKRRVRSHFVGVEVKAAAASAAAVAVCRCRCCSCTASSLTIFVGSTIVCINSDLVNSCL